MLRKSALAVILIVILFVSLSSEEQEKAKQDSMFTEEVEVIGEVALNQSVQSVTLFKHEDFIKLPNDGIKSILNRTAGYLTLSGGHYGQFAYSFARGAAVNQTLYMIDGVKITDPSTSIGLNMTVVAPSLIEKAEIVRGPLSSLYGSNAMGGVVHLKTRKAEGMEAAAFFGSHGSLEGNVYFSKKFGNLHFSVNGNIVKYSDGLDNDEFNNKGVSVRASYDTGFFKAGVMAFGNLADSGIPFYMGMATTNRTYKQNNWLVALPLSYRWEDGSKVQLTVSHNNNKYDFEDPDDFWTPYYTNTSTVNQMVLSGQTKLFDLLNLHAGVDYSDQNVSNEDNFGISIDGETTNYLSAFVNLDLNLDQFLLTGSLRYDKYKDIDANFSPQIGFSYLINQKFKIRGSYSKSFRAPTLPELLNPSWGNPQLEPENGSSFEIGADFYLKSFIFSVAYFDSHYENLIGFSPETWRFANLNEADISGIEVSTTVRLREDITLIGSYTYLDTYDLENDRQLLRRPKHAFSAVISYNNPYFTVSGEMTYVGKRLDYNELDWLNPIADNPAFNTFNFNVQVPLGEKLSLIGKLTNAFNEDYQEVFGYPAPGTRIMAGIRYLTN
jgi:vitamin B12 transporter